MTRHVPVRPSRARTLPCVALVLWSCSAAPPTPQPVVDSAAVVPSAPTAAAGEAAVVPVDDTPCRGPLDARVTVVEFTDFECSHCARAQETLSALEALYPADVRVCFRHRTNPLHFYSRDAAEAAEAARLQGRFWQLHDLLFQNQKRLTPDDLRRYAQRVGLDLARFDRERMQEAVFARVDRDEALAAELKVKATPTFFVNGRRLTGAQKLDAFRAAIDAALVDADSVLAQGVSRAQLYDALMRAARERPATAVPLKRFGAVPILADDPCRGPANAPVTVVEFTDFECPFCGKVKATLDELEARYAGKLQVCIKLSPMPYHPHGRSSSLYALAAARQHKFFTLYDDLFAHQEALDDISIVARARAMGLDVAKLERDKGEAAVQEQLERHAQEARAADLRGTPAFLINGEVVVGAQPLAAFIEVIDRQLGTPGAVTAPSRP